MCRSSDSDHSVHNRSDRNRPASGYSGYNRSVHNHSVPDRSAHNYSGYNHSVPGRSAHNRSAHNRSVYNRSVYNRSVPDRSVYNRSDQVYQFNPVSADLSAVPVVDGSAADRGNVCCQYDRQCTSGPQDPSHSTGSAGTVEVRGSIAFQIIQTVCESA